MKKMLDGVFKKETLINHPEGGRFREVFRSVESVLTASGRTRSALTHIYFSLDPGEVSRFHKVDADEVWNLYRGEGVILHTWDGTAAVPRHITLAAQRNRFCHVVPAGIWQAAEPIEDSVLVGCSVAPGFEFSDFTLMDPRSEEAERLLAAAPEMTQLILP